MVSYPSLQNISYVETEEGATQCEVSGMLLSSLPPRVASLVSSYPACDQNHKQSEMRQAILEELLVEVLRHCSIQTRRAHLAEEGDDAILRPVQLRARHVRRDRHPRAPRQHRKPA